MQAGVESVDSQKLRVGAAFHDAAVFQHRDEIRIADRAQSVGDDKAGSVAHQSLKRLLDQPLRGGVDAGRGLVEN